MGLRFGRTQGPPRSWDRCRAAPEVWSLGVEWCSWAHVDRNYCFNQHSAPMWSASPCGTLPFVHTCCPPSPVPSPSLAASPNRSHPSVLSIAPFAQHRRPIECTLRTRYMRRIDGQASHIYHFRATRSSPPHPPRRPPTHDEASRRRQASPRFTGFPHQANDRAR